VSPAKKKQSQTDVPASTPLNRKYRPQSFDTAELVGQEHIVRTLKNAVRTNRIASAYLFCGPRGTGKTSTARILAKAVNCLDPSPDNRPCNNCTSCNAINTGATPDVIEIDAASNRGIDDIRDLRDRVNYAPTQLRTKFYIIDEAHQITGAAANAFLKTLEEPPAHTKFILATTDPEELLPTIVSRCQRFDFRRHTPEGIASRIQSLAEREGIKLSPDALNLVAELAHGSMRDPIGLLDQLANYHSAEGSPDDELSADDIRELVGITHSEIAIQILVAISESDAKSALQAINEAVNAGQDPRQLNRQIVGLIRDGLYIASGARPASEHAGLQSASERLGLAGWLRVADAFADTDSNIRASVIPQLPLEISVLDAIVGPTVTVSPSSPSAGQIDAGPKAEVAPREAARTRIAESRESAQDSHDGTHSRPTAVPSAPEVRSKSLKEMVRNGASESLTQELASTSGVNGSNYNVVALNNPSDSDLPPANVEITIEMLVEMWPAIRADIKSLDRRTEALLMEIDPVQVAADEITLAAAYDFHRNKVNEDERRTIVESVIARRIGRSVRVHCILRTEIVSAQPTPGPVEVKQNDAPAVEPAVSDAQPDSESPDQKMLGAVVRMFDGEVLDD
jgi:DNA polymerase III subunit gamma/tau